MPVPLEQFVRQLEDSGILVGDTIQDFLPPKASPKDAEELARELVRSKKLTKFQAEEVYKGKGKSLVLGNYILLEKIGAGGMGQVFKAQHRRMHRTVAIKMLPPNVTKDAAAIARFEREVTAAAKLRHPNIVAADDADCANGIHFLVMEMVEGQDLSALVKKNGPFTVEKAVNAILQAAKGLEFAHKKGVVHRDVKPANLLLDLEGTVKILDMGLARLNGDVDAPTQAELTSTGIVMGTVDYMAPEQAMDTKTADARADIYALGCTLYYLLSGKATYGGETLMAKLLAHREQAIPALRAIRTDVPEQLDHVFRKMVAKKVQDRYQSMTEVIVELQRCASEPMTSMTSHQPAITTIQDGACDFLLKLPEESTILMQPTAKAAVGETGRGKKLALMSAAVLGVMILAGIIVSLSTKDGTPIVEIDQPNALDQVLDADGKVEISRRGETPIKAMLVPLNQKPAVVGTKPAVVGEKKGPFFQTPGFDQWMKEVQAMPAEQQVEAVSKKLVELNPGFDGKLMGWGWKGTPTIVDGKVTVLGLWSNHVTDIAPLRALTGLMVLSCSGNDSSIGKIGDLTPLVGLPLEQLYCMNSKVSDLSPLQAMPLTTLHSYNTQVVDLTPLEKCKQLISLNVTKCKVSPADVAALQKAVPNCKIEWDDPDTTPAVGTSPSPLPVKLFMRDPAFQPWVNDVAAMPAEQQVEAVSAKLVELNPGFGGKISTKKAASGEVEELTFSSEKVADLSPIRAISTLHSLSFYTSGKVRGKVSDLSPLEGMKLKTLACVSMQITDLSPLRGMPLTMLDCGYNGLSSLSPLEGMQLTDLRCGNTQVADLTPLRGMPLEHLSCNHTPVSSLAPLKDMPLKELNCNGTSITDVSPLQGLKLKALVFTPTKIANGIDALQMTTTLEIIGVSHNDPKNQFSPAEFWKKYDAGEFGKPSRE